MGVKLSLICCIITVFVDNLKEMDSKLKKASELGIHVVDLSFLDAIKASTNESASSIITKKNIAPWDCHSVNINVFFYAFIFVT